MPGGLDVKVDTTQLRQLYADLKGVEGNLRVELRKGVKNAADPMVQKVRSAAAWSSRIPAAVTVKPSFAAKGASVSIIVNQAAAPEAAPLEHGGQGGSFRHPVFGDRNAWVAQPARPFFYPTVSGSAAIAAAEQAIVAVMDAVARKAGFK